MRYKILIMLVIVLILATTAFSYSGFNRAYYTHNYQPSVYYANPFVTPSHATTYHYYPTTYSTTYATTFVTNRYSAYSAYYYPTRTTIYTTPSVIYAPVYQYPTNYRYFSIYRDSSGWGISAGSRSICGIYGYC